ncbi:retrovirus-related pol polyprotein from transposon TNT 1-94 [Tanacetum coccineum]|uniref:Retrovirus-related pol polyprotein from transposon TNT 1-94 n=1 Tax=Tanacetum coccineum TaxID=301880 RepID=A0ABQ4YCF9_9ASTR
MTEQRDKLINFVSKFIGTVRLGNDHFVAIIGYGDFHIRSILISKVYYVEGLSRNLFSVGQFCDSDLKVAFRKHTCFVRNLEGDDLLSGSHRSNLYTISMEEMMKSSPICLLSKSSKTKSWLWHRCLSHLKFRTINQLAKQGLVKGLPKLKYAKDHVCSACQMGKSKKESHKPKPEPSTNHTLQMLHMDLCQIMRVESINGKKYILVIVDDYSRFTWVKFLRTKDEIPEVIIKILKQAQVSLQAMVRYLHTDNGTEFVNQTLRSYIEDVGITHQTSVARTPQQNGVVERRNRTLVEAARTMLIFSKSPLFLCAEVVATACYTQNKSLIHTRYNMLETANQISRLVPNSAPSTSSNPPSKKDLDILFQPMFDEYFKPPPSVVSTTLSAATLPPDTVGDANVEEPNHENEDAEFDSDTFTNLFAPPDTSSTESSSSRIVYTSNMHTFQQPHSHIRNGRRIILRGDGAQFLVTTSKSSRDDVKISYDGVRVADTEEAQRRFYGLTMSQFTSDVVAP